MNQTIQTALNPQGDQVVRGGRVYRVGDKVMQIRNNYDKDVFNGDMGRISQVDTESAEITVFFEGREVNYEFAEIDELILAYAVSVHKAQGSE
ncbi:MAG: ATP-dependent RecD-like DNA helicase, partial [Deltaproteobacteria bacterium]|nr:ATP-dependent RecD-like DNA helicase [Deltaproteobacteria bacterium]